MFSVKGTFRGLSSPIRELNRYCPGKAGPAETLKSRTLVKKTARFVREIIARYGLD
jgi:hypothetical protein